MVVVDNIGPHNFDRKLIKHQKWSILHSMNLLIYEIDWKYDCNRKSFSWWSFSNSAVLRHIKCIHKNTTNYVTSADFSNSIVYANEMTTMQLVACSQSHFMTNATILRSVPYKRSFYSCGFEQMKDVGESLQIRIWKSIHSQSILSNILLDLQYKILTTCFINFIMSTWNG